MVKETCYSARIAICLLYLLLFMVTLACGTVDAGGRARTVTTTMKVAEDARIPEVELLLVGFSLGDAAARPSLSLVWGQENRGGWFPSWELRLDIAPDLAVSPTPRGDAYAPAIPRKALQMMGPEPGHTYEASLSYDPDSGAVSAAIVDLTSGIRVYAANVRVRTFDGLLYPSGGGVRVSGVQVQEGAAIDTEGSPPLAFEPPGVVGSFVPVGAEWDILTWDEGTQDLAGFPGGSSSLILLDRRRHKELAIRLGNFGGLAAGGFRLTVDDGRARQELMSVPDVTGEQSLLLGTAGLPAGPAQLLLEYVQDGGKWLLDSRALRVGVLEMAMAPVNVDGNVWTGEVTLTGDGAFPGVRLKLGMTMSAMPTLAFEDRVFRETKSPQSTVLETALERNLQEPVTLTFQIPNPLSNHRLWSLHFQPILSKDVTLVFKDQEDTLLLTGTGRYKPPEIAVEVEEEVYRFEPANNGAGPMWARGSTSLVRCGTTVFASGLETIPDAKPLNNCLPLLFRREDDGWKLVYRGTERTREPSPVVCFDDGRLFFSANPTLTEPDVYNGPAEPRILEFAASQPDRGYTTLLPKWEGEPPFTEHSYRSFAADATNHELILFQNIGYTHTEWTLYDRHGQWSAQGQLVWPWAKEYDQPGPVRICYPNVVLKDRAAYFFGVSDVVEPYQAWREYKKKITGQTWDYDFRRLFFTWSDDIRSGQFHQWIEISSRDSTAGWITPSDLHVDPQGNVHLLWIERALDERLRESFFPLEKQSHTLNYAVLRNGVMLLRRVLHVAYEGLPGEIPAEARFHILPSGRLFVFYLVRHASGMGTRLIELFTDGTASYPISVPLRHPMVGYTATPRAGSVPSEYLDLLGTSGNTVRYARVRIADTGN